MKSYGEARWGKPPPGYIPGWGRGAVGFCTRLDIGPARNIGPIDISTQTPQAKQVQNDQKDKNDYSMFNKFYGYNEKLFTNEALDDEDKEADNEYANIDSYMEERRKAIIEKTEMQKIEEKRNKKPTIRQTFSDIRHELTKLKPEDWENIPESKSFINKKRRTERYTPVTDTQIISAVNDNITPWNISNSIVTKQSTNTKDSIENLNKLKNSILNLLFNKMSTNVSGQTSVNPIGYITEMSSQLNYGFTSTNNGIYGNSSTTSTRAFGDIQDFQKARLLLRNLITTNPKNSSAWISAARWEEADGKIKDAQNIMIESTNTILDNEDIWWEAARLHKDGKCKEILMKAISNLPFSSKLWILLINSETDNEQKKMWTRKALENIPTSEELWKWLVESEKDNEDNAKEILYKAVECIPTSINFWWALAKWENYEQAKKVINKAIKKNPNSYEIWVHASMWEEANRSEKSKIYSLIHKAMDSLKANNVKISNEEWITEAIKCEKSQSSVTGETIIKCLITFEHETNNISLKEIKSAFYPWCDKILSEGCLEIVKNIYWSIIEIAGGNDIETWKRWINVMKTYSTSKDEAEEIMKMSIEKSKKESHKELFTLLYAKYLWRDNKITNAIEIWTCSLNKGITENIIIAWVKWYNKTNKFDRSIALLEEGLRNKNFKSNSICRLTMYLIQIHRQQRNFKVAFSDVDKAISQYPMYYKFYLIKAQMLFEESNCNGNNRDQDQDKLIVSVNNVIKEGILSAPKESALYIYLSNVLFTGNKSAQARAILEKGISAIPDNEQLWYHLVNLDIKTDAVESGKWTLSKGWTKLPWSGLLWSLAIQWENKMNQHSKAVDALTKLPEDVHLLLTVGNLYFTESDFDNARRWYKNAIWKNKDIGDVWICYYWMEKGIEDNMDVVNKIKKDFVECEPRHGLWWCREKKKVENWNLDIDEILDSITNDVGVLKNIIVSKD